MKSKTSLIMSFKLGIDDVNGYLRQNDGIVTAMCPLPSDPSVMVAAIIAFHPEEKNQAPLEEGKNEPGAKKPGKKDPSKGVPSKSD